jgi:hypothetical protein
MSMEDFSKIQWPNPANPQVRNQLKRNKRVVKRLCALGKIVTWLEGRRSVGDLYTRMPHTYEVDGVKIRFLPHWDKVDVGRMTIPAISTKRQILRAVRLDRAGKALPANP